MDAEPGGILYLQEFFSDSVNEIIFSFIEQDNSEFMHQFLRFLVFRCLDHQCFFVPGIGI